MSRKRSKRAFLRHNYHDARILSIEISATDVTFVAELYRAWNPHAIRGEFTFHNVKNLNEVRASLPPMKIDGGAWYPTILGVLKMDKTRYLVEAYMRETYPIEIDCRGLTEI